MAGVDTAVGRFSIVRVVSFGRADESLAALDAETMKKVCAISNRHVRDLVHHCW